MDLSASQRTVMDLLPAETLAHIFHQFSDEPNALMQLALVCRLWSEIVMGTGELWSHVTFRNISRRQLRKQLKLSGSASLVLDLEADGIRSTQSVASLTKLVLGWNSPRPIMERLSSLRVMITDGVDKVGNYSPWQPLTEGHSWPRLRMLVVESDREQFRLHVRAPNLEVLNLVVTNVLDWSHFSLGTALRNLQWMGHHPKEAIAAFLQAAAQCPDLQGLCFGAHVFDAVMPPTREDTPLWPKLNRLMACFKHSILSEIRALLTNAPGLTQLCLRFDALSCEPQARLHSHTSSSRPATLRNIVISSYQPEGGENLLEAALMETIYNFYDLAILEEFGGNHIVIPPSAAVPARCLLLQTVRLSDVVLPHDFIDSLGCCLELRDVDISVCGNVATASVVAGGVAFPSRCIQLESLHLGGVILRPEFIADLAQCQRLRSVLLSVPSDSIPSTNDNCWPDTNMISPLLNLTEFTLTRKSSRSIEDIVPRFSLDPAHCYMVSAATQLTLNLSRNVCILIAPLQTSDVARALAARGRRFGNLEFRSDNVDPATFILSLSAGDSAVAGPPNYGTQRKPSFEFSVEERELAGVGDVIAQDLDLLNNLEQVQFAETALEAVRRLVRRNSEAGGLRRLLLRAEATAAYQGWR